MTCYTVLLTSLHFSKSAYCNLPGHIVCHFVKRRLTQYSLTHGTAYDITLHNIQVMLRYRASVADAAARHAEAMGAKGFRFPWESATSGEDVTPPNTCTACSKQQLHVTAGVAWGIRQYYSATRDHDYLTNPDYRACDMSKEIARFWASVSVYNTSKARYDINRKCLATGRHSAAPHWIQNTV